mmetsp:Transcript_38451/g.98334  ORF Transcript_38451/g.98334 Transcript_38451/m.98334 type:complete len:235 (+) Transcript_38451:592-1296(+)
MSAPEYPSVKRASSSKSTSGSQATPRRWTANCAARPAASGSGMCSRFSRRRRIASSRSHGQLVVASTMTLRPASAAEPTPSIWLSSSALKRRDASCSPAPPRADTSASTSSKKTMEGAQCRAIANSSRTSFSDSPRHLEVSVETEQLKKATPFMDATALASSVLPVPGGPNRSTPFQGSRMPVKYSGMSSGSVTASLSVRLATSSEAMSSKVMPGPRCSMSRSMASTSAASPPL